MSKAKNIFFILLLISPMFTQPINSVITCFLQPYPQAKVILDEQQVAKYSKKLQQPGYLFKKIVKGTRVQTGTAGIMCIYLGYVDTSNSDGKITFPRKHQKPILNLLVAKAVKPIFIIAPETINNWVVDESQPAAMYQFTLNHDKETGLFYIEAKKIALPKDNKVPLETIIMIADPKNVFVPEGATISHYSINLILPPIYIRKNFNFNYNALYTLSIKQYFGQISSKHKQENQTVETILQQ